MHSFSPADLPEDWYARHGNELVRELAKINARVPREAARFHAERSLVLSNTLTLDTNLLTTTLPVHTAMRFFNRATMCYLAKPADRKYRCDHSKIPFRVWLTKALDIYTNLCSEDALSENRQTLAYVRLTEEDSAQISGWWALGMRSSLGKQERAKVQDLGLQSLVDKHRRLCDLVCDRAYGPAALLDEVELGPSSWQSDRLGYYYATCPPTCRAVLLLAPYSLNDAGIVMLVLTGDNSHLTSAPPSLDKIPVAQVLKRRAENVAEVSVETAVSFLHDFEIAEETANEEFRRINALRRGHMAAVYHNEAFEHVARLAKEGDKDPSLLSTSMIKALKAVLGDDIR